MKFILNKMTTIFKEMFSYRESKISIVALVFAVISGIYAYKFAEYNYVNALVLNFIYDVGTIIILINVPSEVGKLIVKMPASNKIENIQPENNEPESGGIIKK